LAVLFFFFSKVSHEVRVLPRKVFNEAALHLQLNIYVYFCANCIFFCYRASGWPDTVLGQGFSGWPGLKDRVWAPCKARRTVQAQPGRAHGPGRAVPN
jgi:hypothetical protein